MSHYFSKRVLVLLYRLNPAGVVADNIFVAHLRHSLDLTVDLVLLYVFIERHVDADLLYRVDVLVQTVLYFEDAAEAAFT